MCGYDVIKQNGLSLAQGAVLQCVAHHDGGEGAFLKIATIASEVGASRRTVQYALRDLAESGLIEREGRDNTTTVYRLTPAFFQAGGCKSCTAEGGAPVA